MEPNVATNPLHTPGVYQGAPPSSQEKKEQPAARAIRTMKGDMADAITKQNETAASIALAEAKKLERERAEAVAAQQAAEQARLAALAAKPKSQTSIILTIILLVLIAGGVGSAYMYAVLNSSIITLPYFGKVQFGQPVVQNPAPLVPAKPVFGPALIEPQTEKRIALGKETPDHLTAAIAVERTAGLTPGTVKNFYITEGLFPEGSNLIGDQVSTGRFLNFMSIQPPQEILRSIDPHFMIGLLGQEGSIATPFIVLKISDYETGRAGMLQWESSLSQNFDQLFGTKISSVTSSTQKFRDIIVAGKDARMMNSGNDAGIAYAFFDAQTIVISGSRSSLGETLSRFMKK